MNKLYKKETLYEEKVMKLINLPLTLNTLLVYLNIYIYTWEKLTSDKFLDKMKQTLFNQSYQQQQKRYAAGTSLKTKNC